MKTRYAVVAAIVLLIGFIGVGTSGYFKLGGAGVDEAHRHDDCCPVTASHAEHKGDAHDHAHEEHVDGDACLEEDKVRLSDEAVRQFGLRLATAKEGRLERTLRLPAAVRLNGDRVAHIVPRVAGMVREVHKNIGDQVEAGELMAVLDSRELAEAKAADLANEARLRLAENNFKRVEGLVQKKVSPEQEFHEARQKLEEAQIAHRETAAKLHALGFDHGQLSKLAAEDDADFSRYEIRAPFVGTVIEKHVVLGELHDSSSDVFIVADLSTVWVDITLYAQHMQMVRPGAKVRILNPAASGEPKAAEGTIFHVSPIVSESTRTGLARTALTNEGSAWRPGLFVTAEITLDEDTVPVLVPNETIQSIKSRPVVFVAEDGAFVKREVATGRSNGSHTEIVSGLKSDECYVAAGAHLLKAELGKGEGGCQH